ncbi:MAG: hypothetical protein AB1921_14105 [Thermodesulfobacteriota bacterium]
MLSTGEIGPDFRLDIGVKKRISFYIFRSYLKNGKIKGIRRGGGKTPFEKAGFSPLPRTPAPLSSKLFELGEKAALRGLMLIIPMKISSATKGNSIQKPNKPHRKIILR